MMIMWPFQNKWDFVHGKISWKSIQVDIVEVDGKIFNPVLGAFLRFGYSYDCVVPDYIPDYDSANYGASVVWENK